MPEAETNNQDNLAFSTELPGTVISPGTTSPAATPNPPPVIAAAQLASVAETPAIEKSPKSQPIPAAKVGDGVSWTASEFIAHQKSAGWYGMLIFVSLILAGLVYVLTRDLITTGFIIFGAFILGYYASRQPRELQYQLDASGVTIGDKHYDYDTFRSFSIVTEGAFSSVVFMPLKRFAPLRAVYFAPEQEERIVDMLLPRLPFEEYNHDAVDRLMRRIRF